MTNICRAWRTKQQSADLTYKTSECISPACIIKPENRKIPDSQIDRGNAVISAAQLRAARALLGIDQKKLAEMAGVSLPTIQRMEASKEEHVRGVVSTLTKIIEALNVAGIELIGNEQPSQGRGRGVRLKEPA